MLNAKYIKVKSFKGMSAVVDNEAVDTVAEEAFKAKLHIIIIIHVKLNL